MSGPASAERGAYEFRRSLGARLIFAVVWTVIASAIYFSLGVIAGYALGLTPVVFLAGGVMFALALMTYVEGSSLHQERAGSTVFARYAFNELWSFIAGWALLLDYVILLAVCVFAATNYLVPFWAELGEGAVELAACLAFLAYVAARNVRGFSPARSTRVSVLVAADVAVQLALVVLGLVLLFDLDTVTEPIDLGTSPTWNDVIVALGIATVVSSGLESAAGLAGELRVSRADLRRLVTFGSLTVVVIYTGIALVAISAVPVVDGETALGGRYRDAPFLGLADAFEQAWLRDTTTYVDRGRRVRDSRGGRELRDARAVAARLLAVDEPSDSERARQAAPDAVHAVRGDRHRQPCSPRSLTIPHDLDMLLGLYAFGALLEPDDRSRLDRQAAVQRGRIASPVRDPAQRESGRAGWRVGPAPGRRRRDSQRSRVAQRRRHARATHAGSASPGWPSAWRSTSIYRGSTGKPLLSRVTVPREALRGEHVESEYGSILVPVTRYDDSTTTSCRRPGGSLRRRTSTAPIRTEEPTIEAIWVFEIPMSLPIDARLPEDELNRARTALARAKAVGEEYEGVDVATATVRARRTGQAIVDEARRRGVQAIVLAAEEPSKITGGTRLGGRPGLENYVGEATKHVVSKAPCPVILTAPPVGARRLVRGRWQRQPPSDH